MKLKQKTRISLKRILNNKSVLKKSHEMKCPLNKQNQLTSVSNYHSNSNHRKLIQHSVKLAQRRL